MAQDFRIPTVKKPVDATPEGIQKAFNSLVDDLNNRLTNIETNMRSMTGESGVITYSNDITMGNRRIRGIARSQEGTDAVNRDEVQALIRQRTTAPDGLPSASIRRIDPASATLTEMLDSYQTLLEFLTSRGIIADEG